eukprot:scaffold2340_cov130-Pinguiococcus_pyrenoidosus.AAC.1
MDDEASAELASRCFRDFDLGRKVQLLIRAVNRCEEAKKVAGLNFTQGFLDKDDLQCAFLALLGFRPTAAELRQFVRAARAEHTAEKDGRKAPLRMDEAEFVAFSIQRLRLLDQDEVVREMFQAFDQR